MRSATLRAAGLQALMLRNRRFLREPLSARIAAIVVCGHVHLRNQKRSRNILAPAAPLPMGLAIPSAGLQFGAREYRKPCRSKIAIDPAVADAEAIGCSP